MIQMQSGLYTLKLVELCTIVTVKEELFSPLHMLHSKEQFFPAKSHVDPMTKLL